MDREIGPPRPKDDIDQDDVVVLRDVSWSQYQALLRSRGERPRPRLAYLDGDLEIMTTSVRHELGKKLIARLLETYGDECGVRLIATGSATFRKKAKKAGVEPDECYFIDKLKEAPDIAIEVVHRSGGIQKLEIYRRLKVREVWFWISGRFWLYALTKNRYDEVRASRLLPDFDFDEIARYVLTTDDEDQPDAVWAYQGSLRRRT